MNTNDLTTTLFTLMAELVDGAAREAYILNKGDVGLLGSLEKLSAAAASRAGTGATIAAHADHLRYGLSLMNRWAGGENPFGDADWAASWRRTEVSEAEWRQLRADLRSEAHRWIASLRAPREVTTTELNGMLGSIAHLAYHLGAIRQINAAAQGPKEP